MPRPRLHLIGKVLLLLGTAACAEERPPAGAVDVESTLRSAEIPREHAAGEVAFMSNCASCHGELALGTQQGPPLVNIVYEPSHHADIAFFMAAERGVRAHHWNFGDMPPQPQVDRETMEEIVGYIRFLQRQVGID